MVLLGGLEVVVGGYLVHRHYKNKSEKKKLEEEARQRRQNTFPGAMPQQAPPQHGYAHQITPQHKYACYGSPPTPQPHVQPRPHTAQTFPQTRPYPPHAQSPSEPVAYYHQQIQPLQRADSFATLSHMPVANGSRPSEPLPPLPPRTSSMLAVPQQHPSPYSNGGFSVSTPSFTQHANVSYYHPMSPQFGRNTIDDNWEIYETNSPHDVHSPNVRFDVSTSHPGEHEEEEDDPPPPYVP